MTNDELLELTKWILKQAWVALDLTTTLTNHVRTTKHGRRERAFAYLLENFTGASLTPITHARARLIYEVADQMKANSTSKEVQVACERIMTYLAVMGTDEIGTDKCVACGQTIERGNNDHKCNPKLINRRDAAMGRDDTVKEIS